MDKTRFAELCLQSKLPAEKLQQALTTLSTEGAVCLRTSKTGEIEILSIRTGIVGNNPDFAVKDDIKFTEKERVI